MRVCPIPRGNLQGKNDFLILSYALGAITGVPCARGGGVENEDLAAARRYRQRAHEVRSIAADAEDVDLRSALLRVARDYERLALARLRMDKLARSARMNKRRSGKPR